MKKITISILLIIILNSFICQNNNRRIKTLNGIIEYTFITEDNCNYFIDKIRYIEIKNKDTALICDFLPYMNKLYLPNGIMYNNLSQKKNNLFFSKNYKDQAVISDNPIHYGGDTYIQGVFGSDKIFKIMFNIYGKGVFISRKNIHRINYENKKTCQDSIINRSLIAPVLMLIEFDSTSLLKETQLQMFNLKKVNIDKFPIIRCE